MEEEYCAIDVPDCQERDRDQHGIYSPDMPENQVAGGASLPNTDEQSALEDAQLILGRNVTFSTVSNDDSFDAQEAVERLSNSSTDSTRSTTETTTIYVPGNKVASFHEALREHLVQRSRLVVERAGRMAFWRGKEPFMRPVLSRSLSLP